MTGRSLPSALMIVAVCALPSGAARAQDVPGIEICTAEKTMERRTSCLQSNVNFLQKTITKLGIDNQQKIDAANRQIEALKSMVAELQKTVAELQAAQKKQAAPAPAKPDAGQRKRQVEKWLREKQTAHSVRTECAAAVLIELKKPSRRSSWVRTIPSSRP